VDDSIVRGTTLKHLVRHLHNVDARSVHLLITFPPITSPCHHAINFKTNEELVANNRTVDEIKRELGWQPGKEFSLEETFAKTRFWPA